MSINVTKPFLPSIEEYEEVLERIWAAQWLTNKGPILQEFQKNLESYLGLKRIHTTVNGHIALESAISAYHLNGEIITTPYTFASTTHAIVRQGLKPVFCDIRSDDYTLDPDMIESLITERTSAIIPVHVYGYPCHVEEIEKIAEKHGLVVIYDAAHSFGVRYKGRSLCDYGDSAILSFHATKLFHSIEGGAIVSHSDSFSDAVEGLINFGITGEETVVSSGGNAKMNEFQAAMGLVNLKHIEEIIEERKRISEYYYRQLSGIPGVSYFKPDLRELKYNYAYFPVVVNSEQFGESRDSLYNRLKASGINARKYFYPLTSEFDCYKTEDRCETPVAKRISDSVLCLPIFNGLRLSEIEFICDVISQVKMQ